jgi:hypothetical protein
MVNGHEGEMTRIENNNRLEAIRDANSVKKEDRMEDYL